MKPIVKFLGYECVVEKHKYANGRPALELIDAGNGEPITTATVNLPHLPAGPNRVFIKDYSENEGILSALVAAGIVKPTGETVQSGFVEVPVCELQPPFREQTLSEILADKPSIPSPDTPDRDKDRSR